ncbi:MAG TPA: hypothetical protein VHJ78_09895, partial [Actinomycetota bacterium]|nr:hypothetical protein [Actinomycetota bacterium]
LSELGPCPQDLADFVAGLLADPATLGATARIMPPPERGAEPPAPPAPPPVVVEPQEAVTLPSPVILAASPDPRPRAAAQAPAARYEGLRVALLMVPVPMLLCGAGWWYVRAQGPGTLAWPAAHLKGRSRRQS